MVLYSNWKKKKGKKVAHNKLHQIIPIYMCKSISGKVCVVCGQNKKKIK